jgi:hypothetical protein
LPRALPSTELTNNPSRLLRAGVIGAVAAALGATGGDARAGSGPTFEIGAVSFESAAAGMPPADETCSPLPFDARVGLGEEAEQKEEFKTYHSVMIRQVGDHFAETMRSCFAVVENPETAAFVLVADITAEGRAGAIEVRPATSVARCFAAGFAKAAFPLPPPYPDHDGFPITIKMRIE